MNRPTAEERLWARVEKTETCWLWQGNADKYGRGNIFRNGRSASFYRVAYESIHGPLPKGYRVHRTCGNGRCVRPEHLAAEPLPPRDFATRFWLLVDKRGPDECWPWAGGARSHNGYGEYGHASRGKVRAHRVAYELTHGPIPDGLSICHHCDNPPCCNPAHLFAGTTLDNARDRAQKGRGKGGRPMGDACRAALAVLRDAEMAEGRGAVRHLDHRHARAALRLVRRGLMERVDAACRTPAFRLTDAGRAA